MQTALFFIAKNMGVEPPIALPQILIVNRKKLGLFREKYALWIDWSVARKKSLKKAQNAVFYNAVNKS